MGVFSRQISLCKNFHLKVGVGVISDVGVISVEYGIYIGQDGLYTMSLKPEYIGLIYLYDSHMVELNWFCTGR